jgi:drug/metabolite transporter (DMT)-like permease
MAILAMFFWGMSYVWIKVAYGYLGPFSTVFLRLSLSAIILIFIALTLRIKIIPKINDIFSFLILAFLEPFAYFMGESLGLQEVSSSIASIMIPTIPLFIPIFAFYILKDKISINNIIGLIISFIGILILIFNKDFSFNAPPIGILYMSIAVIAGALYTIQLKKLSPKYHPVTIIISMNIIGLIYFLPFFIYYEWTDFISTEIDFKLIKSIAQLVIFASIAALYLFIHAVEKIGVTQTSMFTNLIPVITVIGAWFILPEEQFDIKLGLGIIVVIVGVFIGQKKSKK